MKRIFSIFIIAIVLITGCSDANKTESATASVSDTTKEFNLTEARASIDADNAKFMEDIRKGDSNAIADHYHSDALALFPNSEPVNKANMPAAVGAMMRMGIKDLKMTTTDLTGDDDLLVETGTYEMLGANNASVDKGKYLVVWKKENGQWKIYRDMINTSMPPMAH